MKWRYPILVGVVIAYTTGIVPSCTEVIGPSRIGSSTSHALKNKFHFDTGIAEKIDSSYLRLVPLYCGVTYADSVRKIFPYKKP